MKEPANSPETHKEKIKTKFILTSEGTQIKSSFYVQGFSPAFEPEDYFWSNKVKSDLAPDCHGLVLRKTGAYLSGAKDWDGFNLCLARIKKARLALRSLQNWYESVLRKNSQKFPLAPNSHQIFFNSQLIYLIALTDDKEDNLGHSQFVAAYALLLARAMGIFDYNFLVDLARGALLHDIGKIGLPPSILCKAGSLTPLEREIIKEHPLLGYLLLQEYPFLEGAVEVVLFHHEWFNGRGYPFGLKGEEIPLAARIFSLADTLDAILSDRPYRRGRSFEVACDEIEKGSGSQFDPAIVDIFFSVSEENWLEARSQALNLFRLPLVH